MPSSPTDTTRSRFAVIVEESSLRTLAMERHTKRSRCTAEAPAPRSSKSRTPGACEDCSSAAHITAAFKAPSNTCFSAERSARAAPKPQSLISRSASLPWRRAPGKSTSAPSSSSSSPSLPLSAPSAALAGGWAAAAGGSLTSKYMDRITSSLPRDTHTDATENRNSCIREMSSLSAARSASHSPSISLKRIKSGSLRITCSIKRVIEVSPSKRRCPIKNGRTSRAYVAAVGGCTGRKE